MTRTVQAVYDGKALKLKRPLGIKPNTQCTVTVVAVASKKKNGSAFEILESLIGSVKMPRDWSEEHDHYLYGTPKCGKKGR
ncbi:MAG: hypothetical protein HY291_07920 [Planctomycetes bacterium]|nr:hypothetical protein [Planctomycetota bacterium]